MADVASALDDKLIAASASPSPLQSPSQLLKLFDAVDDSTEDVCSICLESFTTQDPSTVTCCKHEYHLQCILEWSQRSKECPICWKDLVLKDASSQELLAAVEYERSLRVRPRSSRPSTVIQNFQEDSDTDHDASYSDDSDFDERIMQHLAAASGRDCYVRRRGSQTSSGFNHTQVLFVSPTGHIPDGDKTHNSSEERQYSSYGIVVGESSNSSIPSIITVQPSPPTNSSISAVNGDNSLKPRVLPCPTSPDSPRRSSGNELSFSESMKLKFSAASSRCKESISKGTRGFKDKLLVHNNSVKELSKGVQREMNAGISGVAKVLERLDISSKRSGSSVADSTVKTSNLYSKGKSVQDNDGHSVQDISSGVSSYISITIPGCVKVSPAQSRQ